MAPSVEASVGEAPQASGAKAFRGVEARGMAADWPAANLECDVRMRSETLTAQAVAWAAVPYSYD